MSVVKMRWVVRPGLRNEPPQVGDFYWDMTDGERSLVLAVPWPGSGRAIWSSWNITKPNINGAQWEWDGNERKPTLSPSLHWVDVWHGFVRNGVMETV